MSLYLLSLNWLRFFSSNYRCQDKGARREERQLLTAFRVSKGHKEVFWPDQPPGDLRAFSGDHREDKVPGEATKLVRKDHLMVA